ncbi:TPA: N-acetylneuraminate epimerase [Yersinia enterocolitica]|uniref:N-acetylneuraminate epimerase n=1 Tax=Yersinia enterocolitica TaxID=630 RepID=UPI0029BD96D2|nr:N-acetylneuraminate epimerase [Yersinia enterocolitica]HDM8439498.1 N-acetylneuraminate epimerase [Yersinia enterocolitica]HEI6852703.1 N-acetylneuraminate epimerase [Yersinia enterocolitica]HEN3580027.1 N-acetylneuraminate epimerase [Yersinia enterocolitica]HEN3602567.1 N-acetylneuraminate epimerase [Yersinia enterocolitica]
MTQIDHQYKKKLSTKVMLLGVLIPFVTLSLSYANAENYPDVPVPFKYGTGTRINNNLYIGLGSADQSWYRLDTDKASDGWQKIADFPGQPREQAVTLALDGKLYVFGGVGKNSASDTQVRALDDVYQYDPQTNQWQRLATRAPRGLVGTAATSLNGSQALLLGGVNKAIFDGYFADMASAGSDETLKNAVINAYFDQNPADYFYNRDVLVYDPAKNQWKSGGQTPFLGTAGSAIATINGNLILINGEIKPGLRTTAVWQGKKQGTELQWQQRPDLIAEKGAVQEGLAGAFAGVSHDVVLVGGGANFPGSWQQFNAGQLYAHKGLKKQWQQPIYALVGNQWQIVGQLPQPLGYGVSIQDKDKVILVGGETSNGVATSTVTQLSWQGGKLHIE